VGQSLGGLRSTRGGEFSADVRKNQWHHQANANAKDDGGVQERILEWSGPSVSRPMRACPAANRYMHCVEVRRQRTSPVDAAQESGFSTIAESGVVHAEVCMSRLAFVLVVTLVSGVQSPSTDSLRHTFLTRVDSYVALHRHLEGPLPPEAVTADGSASM
jgi:hypothetical protein